MDQVNEPPSIPLPPMGVRYPLYADEVDTFAPEAGFESGIESGVEPEDTLHVGAFELAEPARARPRRAGSIAVVVALVLLIGMGLVGWRLLSAHRSHAHSTARTSSTATDSTAGSGAKALVLSASAPITAPPGRDTAGNAVTYAASNMLDGQASTAWRMPGDGTGTTLTFTLAHPATITSVGLINGYAKTESGLDWYAGNRRVLEVAWTFDDGTTVKQTLHSSRALQRIAVPDVRTGSVKLTLLQVSQPGKGPARRDMTAVSEVQIDG